MKILSNLLLANLKIHVEYQIAVHNQEKPSYSENVLARIKELDQLTFHLTILLASRHNYTNELDLDQANTELSSDNE
ncbi:14852_t:CDS:2 [Racocetra fulgida]|uniref:14852_t:CDS:1 n=1 Tax=Racocetra fulgida TaxID=60492 RepID=A0A9N9A2U5_9GLOM|nr:14852_t:CDS:2 [Racocetra fulgida]